MQTLLDKFKSALTGRHYETRITRATGAGLQRAYVTASKPEEKKDDNKKKYNGAMTPFKSGYDMYRITKNNNGGITRLKRRNA